LYRTARKWKQHFCKVLNREVPDNPVDVEETDEICEINSEEPSILEIRNAIRKLKNGKAPGMDNITAEFTNRALPK
jgi:hypothetical protein